jgi:hypothetical protein
MRADDQRKEVQAISTRRAKMNREPPGLMLRLRDVLAWIPRLTAQELYKWEEAGLITTYRCRPGAGRWYYAIEIAKVAKINLALGPTIGHNNEEKGEGDNANIHSGPRPLPEGRE